MLANNTISSNKFNTTYTVSPKLVNELLSTINVKTEKTHSKSFFKSFRNRKNKIKNAKTA